VRILRETARQKKTHVRSGRESHVPNEEIIITDKETTLLIVHRDATVRLSSKLLGRFNASNLTGAFAVGKLLGIETDVLIHGLKKVRCITRTSGTHSVAGSRHGDRGLCAYSDALLKNDRNDP